MFQPHENIISMLKSRSNLHSLNLLSLNASNAIWINSGLAGDCHLLNSQTPWQVITVHCAYFLLIVCHLLTLGAFHSFLLSCLWCDWESFTQSWSLNPQILGYLHLTLFIWSHCPFLLATFLIDIYHPSVWRTQKGRQKLETMQMRRNQWPLTMTIMTNWIGQAVMAIWIVLARYDIKFYIFCLASWFICSKVRNLLMDANFHMNSGIDFFQQKSSNSPVLISSS